MNKKIYMVYIIIIAYSLLIIFEFAPLYRKKNWLDFWINAVLALMGFTIAVLLGLNAEIPSPEKPIREFIISVFGK